jgi:hypothetical protein
MKTQKKENRLVKFIKRNRVLIIAGGVLVIVLSANQSLKKDVKKLGANNKELDDTNKALNGVIKDLHGKVENANLWNKWLDDENAMLSREADHLYQKLHAKPVEVGLHEV